MKAASTFWLLIVLSTSCFTGVTSPSNAVRISEPKTFDLAAIDKYVAAQIKELGIAGASLAIVRDGQLLLARGYGAASLEKNNPVTTNTLFAIGSVTKQFACACILLLAEQGKLSVEDKVGKYFPNLTRANEITVLDLMNHVSGYPDYYPLDFVDRRMARPIEVDDLIQQYAAGKLDFEPGTRWSYSNTGFVILGRVVEKVTGDSFGHFLQRHIFEPLGMTRTAFEPVEPRADLAQGYCSFALGPLETATPEGQNWLYSAGGIYSTASDLAKWDLALVSGALLKADSYKLMTTPRKLANGKVTNYGCGLGLSVREGWAVLSHNGAVSGFAARNTVIPDKKAAVVLLSNADRGNGFAKLHNKIVSLLLTEPSQVPAIRGKTATEAAKDLFRQLQSGQVQRKQLGTEFSEFLDGNKLRSTAKRLAPYGTPTAVQLEDSRERGGLEVTTLRLSFRSGSLSALMYRQPDGTIEQFFVEAQ